MRTLSTSTQTHREAAQAVVRGSVVCGQAIIGMKPAPCHAINPRDTGGLVL